MDKISELIQQIRHYSQLRFAIFAVFLAITGGLLAAFFRSCESEQFFLMLAGVTFSAIFAYFQLKLGAVYNKCLEELKTSAEGAVKGDGEFIRLLFGETIHDPIVALLNASKKWLEKWLPGELLKNIVRQEFLGPVTLAVVLLHLLVILVWLVLV